MATIAEHAVTDSRNATLCSISGGALKTHGTETYYFYGSTNGKRLAEAIHNQLLDFLPLLDRKVKEAGFTVLANTDMSAALLKQRQDDFAKAIALGISDYFI